MKTHTVMIYQLHHQNIKTGKTVACAQQEISNKISHTAARSMMNLFVEETMNQYPIPDDPYVKWMICNQKSKYFKEVSNEATP